jgi:hypothetical protein
MRKGSIHKKPSLLPSGYTELAYIQSSGTQYVDTGFKPKNTTKVTADFQVTTQPTSHLIIFGCRTSYSSSDQFVLGYTGHKSPAAWRSDFGGTQASFPSTVGWASRYAAVFDSSVCTLNADSVNNTDATFTSTHNLFLLADNDNETAAGNISANLYACQIYDNGTLIRNYVPCIDPSGVVGLYDLTGKQFYGNSGTGVFYAGPPVVTLPDGYTQLMYLESSGTQYIDAGLKPDQDTRLLMDAQLTSTSNYPSLFGTRNQNKQMFWLFANSATQIIFGFGDSKPSATCTMSDRLAIDANKNTLTVNGSVLATATASTFSADINLYLCATNNYGTLQYLASMKLYSCRIYNNGLMVRDFIPCRNASGTIGLYDLVNGQFYTNAGTGTFTAGEVA